MRDPLCPLPMAFDADDGTHPPCAYCVSLAQARADERERCIADCRRVADAFVENATGSKTAHKERFNIGKANAALSCVGEIQRRALIDNQTRPLAEGNAGVGGAAETAAGFDSRAGPAAPTNKRATCPVCFRDYTETVRGFRGCYEPFHDQPAKGEEAR